MGAVLCMYIRYENSPHHPSSIFDGTGCVCIYTPRSSSPPCDCAGLELGHVRYRSQAQNYEDNTHSPSFPRICIEDSICMADGCVSANVTLYDLFSFQRRENVFARRYRKTNRRLYNVVGLFISVTWGRRVKRRRHFYCSGLPPFFCCCYIRCPVWEMQLSSTYKN